MRHLRHLVSALCVLVLLLLLAGGILWLITEVLPPIVSLPLALALLPVHCRSITGGD